MSSNGNAVFWSALCSSALGKTVNIDHCVVKIKGVKCLIEGDEITVCFDDTEIVYGFRELISLSTERIRDMLSVSARPELMIINPETANIGSNAVDQVSFGVPHMCIRIKKINWSKMQPFWQSLLSWHESRA